MGRRPAWKTTVNTDPSQGPYFTEAQVEVQRQRRRERATPPSDDVAIERVLRVFSHATDEEIQAGIEWYLEANAVCHDLLDRYPASTPSVYHVAGVVAALSPRLSWEDNIRRATEMIATGRTLGVSHWVDLAANIRNGKDPFEAIFDPSRQNWKVRSFLMNICFPHWHIHPKDQLPEELASQDCFVTIDRHAWGVLYDDRNIGDVVLRPSRKLYEWGRGIFIAAADELDDIMPTELQAITWLVWRSRRDVSSAEKPATLF